MEDILRRVDLLERRIIALEGPKYAIDRDAMMALPIRSFPSPVSVVETPEAAQVAISEIVAGDPLLGFDTETRPSFKKGEHHNTCLVQLATRDRAWIFRIDHHPGIFRQLLPVLTSSTIRKIGMGAGRDIIQLQQDYEPFEALGIIDLDELAVTMQSKPRGLRGLVAIHLGFRITKQKTSNWERRPLTAAQVAYAATDAWVGRLLYDEFSAKRLLH